MSSKRWLAAMPWVFVVIWSTGFIIARYAMPHAPPLTFLSMRYGLSMLCFGIWIAFARPRWPRDRDQFFHLAVTGALMHAGYLGGVWAAVRHGIAAGTVALIVGLQPVLTALWISLASRGGDGGGPTVTRLQWVGLGLGLLGLALVVGRKFDVGEVDATNLTLALIALASMTVGTLYQKRHLAACDFRTASFVQLAAALLVSAPLALLEREPVVWHPEMLGALAWSVFAMTLGASSLLYLLLQRGAAMQFTSLLYLVPPCTALMAWALFREPLTVVVLTGMMLTALGVWLALRESPVAGRPVREPPP